MLKHRQSGVSLIELIVGLAILSIMLALGVPQYATYLANARLKAITDTLVSGLSLARAEAVNRNAHVEIVLTNEEPIEALVNAVPADDRGINWIVRERVPSTGGHNFIEGRFGAEGGGKSTGSTVEVLSSRPIISFDGFGSSRLGGVTIQITNSGAGACVAANGPIRCLTITVTSGGQIRTCDPAVPTGINDTRSCPNPLP